MVESDRTGFKTVHGVKLVMLLICVDYFSYLGLHVPAHPPCQWGHVSSNRIWWHFAGQQLPTPQKNHLATATFQCRLTSRTTCITPNCSSTSACTPIISGWSSTSGLRRKSCRWNSSKMAEVAGRWRRGRWKTRLAQQRKCLTPWWSALELIVMLTWQTLTDKNSSEENWFTALTTGSQSSIVSFCSEIRKP